MAQKKESELWGVLTHIYCVVAALGLANFIKDFIQMKNLVKILATLGLIVAIALILKGVFGVGKIGLKKVSKNNTIIFDQCYNPSEFSSYEKAYPSDWFEKWNFKINELYYYSLFIKLEKKDYVQHI